MRYPDARRLDLVETIYGHQVADPYRWLEHAASEETEQWSQAQDALAQAVLGALPGRDRAARRLRALLPGMVSAPTVLGDRAFFLRREPEDEFAVLYVAEAGAERPLIDPARLDPSLTTVLDAAVPSWEGERVAYLLSRGGREESELRVLDVATGEDVAEPVMMGRGADVAWVPGGDEVIVVRRLPHDRLPPGEEQFHRRVWRHHIGTPPAHDDLLFGEGRDKRTYYDVRVSSDGRTLAVVAAIGTEPRNDAYLVDLATGDVTVLLEGVDAQATPRLSFDGTLYVLTDLDAPRRRVCIVDPADPAPDRWRDVLPQTDDVLVSYAITRDALVAVRTRDVVARVSVHDKRTGAERSTIALPGLGSASVAARPLGGDDVWITYTDHVTPPTVYHWRPDRDGLALWAEPPSAPQLPAVDVRQVFFPSKDGTTLPMFVIAPHGTALDGDRPTILYGYGGFNISLDPEYANSIAAWIEAGGVYAVANLRGGSEYGEKWHRAGMRAKKQNVFDDFLAAADWLIDNGYTSPDHLAISGGSNGGLLVGAALTQRPDRFRAVSCSAPLLDMVRYERFGLGETWNDEYGRADRQAEFEWLLSYSPYHHVQPGVAYPAVIFSVFEGDTRVDPLHARKLCAALQAAQAAAGLDPAERPVILRRETDVGHGERAISLRIALQADTMAFLAAQVGLAL
jgi:prolyl oligopeptidase